MISIIMRWLEVSNERRDVTESLDSSSLLHEAKLNAIIARAQLNRIKLIKSVKVVKSVCVCVGVYQEDYLNCESMRIPVEPLRWPEEVMSANANE